MSLFKTYTLTVKRPTETMTKGTYIDGRWIEGDLTLNTFTIQTSVQPANGKDLEVLPEGLRTNDIFKIYPKTKLQAVDQHNNQEADIVIWDGKDYEVIFAGDWQNNLISHYKALIQRVKE